MRKRKETIYKYEAIFDPNGDGYTVTVPKLPGLVTEGDTLKEARGMTEDAIKCYLESVLKSKVFHSPQTHTTKRRMRVEVSI